MNKMPPHFHYFYSQLPKLVANFLPKKNCSKIFFNIFPKMVLKMSSFQQLIIPIRELCGQWQCLPIRLSSSWISTQYKILHSGYSPLPFIIRFQLKIKRIIRKSRTYSGTACIEVTNIKLMKKVRLSLNWLVYLKQNLFAVCSSLIFDRGIIWSKCVLKKNGGTWKKSLRQLFCVSQTVLVTQISTYPMISLSIAVLLL